MKKKANSHKNIQNNLQDDKTIFGFIFKNLDTALLFGMCFLIYAIFDTFTKFVQDNAHFIEDLEQRKPFAFTLIFFVILNKYWELRRSLKKCFDLILK